MCLLELFRLHVTHNRTVNKSKSYASFKNAASAPRINSHYPEFLLLKVAEDSLDTVSTTIPDSTSCFDFKDCSKFHIKLRQNEKRNSARYVRYASKTGCVGYVESKGWRGGTNTLDLPLAEAEILKYFVETSNWFLFRKNDRVVSIMDMFFK
ncbi:hypothetical protein BDFB_010419 [Asbolus verrucosus]|uniref:Uncharacterized protein n=1 Tax=Asbolus verrucosus TaxID=1661398 RepID=A0A482VCS0_ASBVE|nr:hypothetical protein BDFB_010419 [Asbolus verrucosus]